MSAYRKVKRNQTLSGFSSERTVQIFILSNDNKWYLQKNVVFIGESNRFSVDCVFGNEKTPCGSEFNIIAVVTSERPHSPTLFLPAGLRSEPIKVILKK